MQSLRNDRWALYRLIEALGRGSLSPKVFDAWPYTSQENQSQEAWVSPYFSLQLGIRGQARYEIEGRTVSCGPGDLILFSPQIRHGYSIPRGLSAFFMSFQLIGERGPVRLADPFLRIKADRDVLAILRQIGHESRVKSSWQDVRIASQFVLLLTGFSTALKNPKNHRVALDHGQFDRISVFISRNAHRSIEPRELAELLRMSQGYFRRIFKRYVGVSAKVFIMQEKMRLASTLLKQSRISVAEVADRLGYVSLPSFSRQYQRFFGVSPGHHRMEDVGWVDVEKDNLSSKRRTVWSPSSPKGVSK